MDTRLKNSHRISVFLCVFLVTAAALLTVLAYPYIQEKAAQWHAGYEQSMEESSQTEHSASIQIMNSVYQAWREQKQKEAGKILTPSQVFLPGLDEKIRQEESVQADDAISGEETWEEETWDDSQSSSYDSYYYEDLQSTMDSVGQEWQSFAREYSQILPYEMMDSQGNILGSNVENPSVFFSQKLENGQMRLTLHFDESGAVEVKSVDGPDVNRDRMGNLMTNFQFYDPLEQRVSGDYRYSGVAFSGPRDVTYVYQFDLSDFRYIDGPTTPALYDYVSSGGYYGVVAIIGGILALLAFILPAIRPLGLGERRGSRLSFEPMCVLGFCWAILVCGGVPAGMIELTARGEIIRELTEAGILPAAAEVLEFLANLAVWMFTYGILFWMAVSAGSVLRLGLWRYLKERTWTLRFCRFIKRWVVRCLNPFNEVDWHSNSTKAIGKAVIANFIILALISLLWFAGIGVLVIYSLVLFVLIQRYWKQMQEKYDVLLNAINQMAEGNLDVDVTENLGLFEPLKEQLARVRQGFKKAVDQEVKSERTKTELITNVSHDLKTPLTAIITYVNLLKQPGITKEEQDSYIDVLEQKSMRLKVLIEDLFEVSKASSGSVNLHLEPVDLVSLIKEVRLELSERIAGCGVDFRWKLPEEKVIANLDGQRTYRIFENLLVNITKYAMPNTRAYVTLETQERWVVITLMNISAAEVTVSPQELMERFVRGDESRNTEGSGLGLAIAKSFTELQDGTMELSVEGDLFRVVLRWKMMEEPASEGSRED
ncbi:MAG TPA: sensor histidine kinase [Candidatus Enterocloster faecavium]|uniref:histidine kinase n=1 Tax=Candidatus Enterocloster faecavium TaxID=2838560 RepID=A0A9D2L7W0_9FIRM|nr:sensor histidine kinase [Candidatus Enterocloster faecavium]